LSLLCPLFAAGLGGRVGGGRQWTYWIDVVDLADVYYRAVGRDGRGR
jgi:NAD dependent epimerase/dehydratase family enzyme